ncbi:MAG: CoA transferase [Peptococcaceae bacterium]|nr:CoA transferase [Peptococcaceae bacterium]
MSKEDYLAWANEAFDIRRIFDKPEALKGLRVVELCTLILGPAHAVFLAEMGAEVIKVELPGTGDTMRYVSPRGMFWQNQSLGFFSENRNKYHVTIDVRKAEGKELFKKLIARADVFIENLTAGTMDEWGLGYHQLSAINPGLIYIAKNGFGQWGPYAKGRASYDAVAQAQSGIGFITGFPGRPPLKMGIFIGDYFGAIMSAASVMAALHYRKRTGRGQFIDYAQSEGLIRMLDWTWAYQYLTGQDRDRYGNWDVAICPSGIFRCGDGFIAIAAATDAEFAALAKAMDRPGLAEDARFRTLADRLKEENSRELQKILDEWTAGKTQGEIDRLGGEFGFAAAPVYSEADTYRNEHWRARGATWQHEDPVYGDTVEYGPVVKMSETPGRIKWSAKPVGFDNEFVFGTILGLGKEEQAVLKAKGITTKWADRVGAKPPDDWQGEGLIFNRGGEE